MGVVHRVLRSVVSVLAFGSCYFPMLFSGISFSPEGCFLMMSFPSSSNFGHVFVRCVPDTRFLRDLRVDLCVQWGYHEFVTKVAC